MSKGWVWPTQATHFASLSDEFGQRTRRVWPGACNDFCQHAFSRGSVVTLFLSGRDIRRVWCHWSFGGRQDFKEQGLGKALMLNLFLNIQLGQIIRATRIEKYFSLFASRFVNVS
jgi:hypothetical protein